MSRYIKTIFVVLAFAVFCGGCASRYKGSHIIAGELSGDVEIIGYESVSFQSECLFLKDGGQITLGKGMFILFTDTCPICGTKGEDDGKVH